MARRSPRALLRRARRRPQDDAAKAAVVEAKCELLLEASCRGPKFGRATAHLVAERRRARGRTHDTAYGCPVGTDDHYHVGPCPSPERLERIARALRGLDPDQ